MIGNHFLTEGQIEALRPRVTFTLAHLWRVQRTDGVVKRFVSHDKWVHFRGEDYMPVGPNASDMEQGEAASESDFEMLGFLSADTIRASDIHANRYDGASIEHYVIDWMRPWVWFRKHRWWIKEINESGDYFRAEVQGVERFLTIPAGRRYERECDKVFGSGECGATPIVTTNCVVAFSATPSQPFLGVHDPRRAFSVTVGSWPVIPRAGLVNGGKVVWVTGPNKGLTSEVAEHEALRLALVIPTPFPIKTGDVFDVWTGCDGSFATCVGDYSNGINYGGQRYMPDTATKHELPKE